MFTTTKLILISNLVVLSTIYYTCSHTSIFIFIHFSIELEQAKAMHASHVHTCQEVREKLKANAQEKILLGKNLLS